MLILFIYSVRKVKAGRHLVRGLGTNSQTLLTSGSHASASS